MPRYVNIENCEALINSIVMLHKDCKMQHRESCLAPNCEECVRRSLSYKHLLPTADVQEVKHGKWIDVFVREVYVPAEKTTIALTEQKCSCCNVVTTFKGDKQYLPDFNCPNCGADMGREL